MLPRKPWDSRNLSTSGRLHLFLTMSRKRRLEIELPSVSEVIEIAKDPPVSLRLRPKKAKSRRASETPHEQSQGKNKVILSGLMDIEQRTATLEKDEIEEEVRNILGMMHSPMAIQNGFVRSKAAAVLARTLCIPHCPSTIVDQGVEELLMQLKRDGWALTCLCTEISVVV